MLPAGSLSVSHTLVAEPDRLYTLVGYATDAAIDLEVILRGAAGTIQHQETIAETRPTIYAIATKEASTIEVKAKVSSALATQQELYILAVREVTL